MNVLKIEFRPALVADAAEVARLSCELGYPVTSDDMRRRLEVVLENENHHVVVASRDERLVGWMHVEHRESVVTGSQAELMGLVVDPAMRRSGIGRELVAAAERWAFASGHTALRIRSNVVREQSHPFYESLGYERKKTQHVYLKSLTAAPAPGGRREGVR